MTTDVEFGKLDHTIEDGKRYDFVSWPGIYRDWENEKDIGLEDDGTSKEWTIFSGRPIRSFSSYGFYEWVNRIPQAGTILELCKPQHPNTQDPEQRKIDQTLLDVIGLLPEAGEPCDIDRAKWFKYWSGRALEEFGEAAYISFS
ncbi:MAG: hypothetical protein GY938_05475 [Ketobacter sp.]|nr:hypothetical protein [Chloroflexota bacterium]MCP5014720.1 hypothetical protein [Ketobacter sp.]